MGIAFLILFIGMIMKVGSVARGWGCRSVYDPFGDWTDQMPRNPGSTGDSFSRFAGSAIDLSGSVYNRFRRWRNERNLTPAQRANLRAVETEIDSFESVIGAEIADFNRLVDLSTR
ncbi:hypothetical protein KY326_04755, partial [Candidatus Woesearchaeota archaeon]|nr:hypothetical protein [Candidatus Woesearchaeota archaeon]